MDFGIGLSIMYILLTFRLTLVSIITLILVFILAGFLKGKSRWVMLVFGPLVFFLVQELTFEGTLEKDSLWHLVISDIILIGMVLYYPILAIIWFVKFLRKRKKYIV